MKKQKEKPSYSRAAMQTQISPASGPGPLAAGPAILPTGQAPSALRGPGLLPGSSPTEAPPRAALANLLLGGQGQTSCCPVASAGPSRSHRIGSVGRRPSGSLRCEVRAAPHPGSKVLIRELTSHQLPKSRPCSLCPPAALVRHWVGRQQDAQLCPPDTDCCP